MRVDLVLAALQAALGHRVPAASGLLFHSDRGSQYASHAYQAALEAAGICCSMSRRGNCWDNAVAESFFGTLKTKLIHSQCFATRETAKTAVVEWIEVFYNRQRIHSVDTPAFLSYVNDVLAPQLWGGAIVVMDNLKVRHAHSVRDAIEAVGARLVFLPPYSPDLSPIELCGSKLKQFLRSKAARTYEALDQAMSEVVNVITEDDAIGWFNHCGLFT